MNISSDLDTESKLAILQQEVNRQLFGTTQGREIDVNHLIELQNRIKDQLALDEINQQKLAEIWYQSGKYMNRLGKSDVAEICFFMANLYDKTNVEYIDQLICAYVSNEKYSFAIDFLERLYIHIDQENDHVFWSRLVSILPTDDLVQILIRPRNNGLEDVIYRFELEESEVMTWMMLGYTLKTLDVLPNHLILANQALDNALALKYFN